MSFSLGHHLKKTRWTWPVERNLKTHAQRSGDRANLCDCAMLKASEQIRDD